MSRFFAKKQEAKKSAKICQESVGAYFFPSLILILTNTVVQPGFDLSSL